MKKTHIFSLCLGASISLSTHSATQFNIDMLRRTIKPQLTSIKSEISKRLPLISTLVTKIEQGDFEGLRSYLKANRSLLEIDPVLRLIQDNTDRLKEIVIFALNNIPEQIKMNPNIQKVVNTVRNNLHMFGTIRTQLVTIRPRVNLIGAIDIIVDNLKIFAESPFFAKFKGDIRRLYTEVRSAAEKISHENIDTISNALDQIALKLQNQPFNLVNVINGSGKARVTIIQLFKLIQNSIKLSFEIDRTLLQAVKMPKEVRQGLQLLDDNTAKIHKALQDLSEEIKRALM